MRRLAKLGCQTFTLLPPLGLGPSFSLDVLARLSVPGADVVSFTWCGTDTQCIELRRINVSAAFFLSIEFQETGYLSTGYTRRLTTTCPARRCLSPTTSLCRIRSELGRAW